MIQRALTMSLPVNKVSTSDFVAACRAWHLREHTPVFEDPFAERLCGPHLRLAVRLRPIRYLLFRFLLRPVLPITMCIVMRARFTEEALTHAVGGGMRQYVIIGAGMDSFAFRRPDLMERIDVFEIDHPVTQRLKRERLERARLEIARNHHLVAADLSRISPADALKESPFDASRPAFLSLLGVTYYLTPETLESAARSIAKALPAGTRLIFDYLLVKDECNPAHLELRQSLLDFVKGRGEPMRSEYSLAGLHSTMEAAGFRPVTSIPISALEDSYRTQLGSLPFEIPGLFGFADFEVVGR